LPLRPGGRRRAGDRPDVDASPWFGYGGRPGGAQGRAGRFVDLVARRGFSGPPPSEIRPRPHAAQRGLRSRHDGPMAVRDQAG